MARAFIEFLLAEEDGEPERILFAKPVRIAQSSPTDPLEQLLAYWRIRHRKASVPPGVRSKLVKNLSVRQKKLLTELQDRE